MAALKAHIVRASALAALLVGCTAVVDADIAQSGIGGRCTASTERGTCNEDGLCVATCGANAIAPRPPSAWRTPARSPQRRRPLGRRGGRRRGLETAHDEGMRYAKDKLSYVNWVKRENIVTKNRIYARSTSSSPAVST